MPAAPSDLQKSKDEWAAWFSGLGKALVVRGGPAAPGRKIDAGGTREAGDGFVSGYTIVQADNLDSAVAVAETSPIIKAGGSIEVSQLLPV